MAIDPNSLWLSGFQLIINYQSFEGNFENKLTSTGTCSVYQ